MLVALLVGLGLLLGSVLLYSMAMALFVRFVVMLIRSGYTEFGFWKNVLVMMLLTLLTAVAHLLPITLWAVVLLLCGETANLEEAIYFSAQSYTAVGYGDIAISRQWRILGPLEAVNGLLLFGLSTGLLFAVLSRLIASHLRFQVGRSKEKESLPGKPEESQSASDDSFQGAC
jgi:hypothetical protein